VDSRIIIRKRKNCWLLSRRGRLVYGDLVRPFTHPTRNIELIAEQGDKDFHYINSGPDNSLVAIEEDPIMCENFIFNALPCADSLPPGVAGFFFLEFTATIVQPFLVCELTHTEWKQTPGSICLLPRFVPISLAVSKLPHPSYNCLFVNRLDPQCQSSRTPS